MTLASEGEDHAVLRVNRSEAERVLEAAERLIELRSHPGFILLMRHLRGESEAALQEFLDADAAVLTEPAKVLALQNRANRYYLCATSVEELILQGIAIEIVDEVAEEPQPD